MPPASPRSILILQTAFIGDVILATALIEKLHLQFPKARIDFLLRKGNEGLLDKHPLLREVLVWDKKKSKLRHLFQMILKVRKTRYDLVVNVHRFASSGLIAGISGAGEIIGFDKNPLSFLFDKKVKHIIGDGEHETARNQKLIAALTDAIPVKPRLYPTPEDFTSATAYKNLLPAGNSYICVAPASVWFTKQFPKVQWISFLDLPELRDTKVFLLGAPGDRDLCQEILQSTVHKNVVNLAGKLNFLASAALMKGALMNYVNDSAPMHIASAMNAPVAAIYCSTIPAFGFGPLSDVSHVIETTEKLDCRPCGLHGYKACPLGHFKCAATIKTEALSATLN